MRLALGTVQFGLAYGIANQGGQTSRLEAGAILEHASACGIDMLDTAIAYGDSEQCLGEIGIQNWKVISKLPAMPADCTDVRGWVAESVQASMDRLGVEHLYGLLLHRPQQLLESQGEQLFRALEALKADGLVAKTGVSAYGVNELDALAPHYRFDLVQAPFNVLDQGLLSSGWMKRMAIEGTELHVRSLFLQGLLLMTPSARPQKFSRWADLWQEWDSWLRQSGLSPLQACTRYVLSFPEIAKAVTGVDNLVQLRQIVDAASGALPLMPPLTLRCDDPDLINPSRWHQL